MRGSDEYCPHCDNHFVLDAKVAKPRLEVEGEDARIDSRYARAFYSMGCKLTQVQNDQRRSHPAGRVADHLRRQGGTQQAGLSKRAPNQHHHQRRDSKPKRRAEQHHVASVQWEGRGKTCASYAIFCALAGGVGSLQSHKVYHVDAVQFMGAVNRNYFSMRLILSPRPQQDASG
jgi:hypothetical protein